MARRTAVAADGSTEDAVAGFYIGAGPVHLARLVAPRSFPVAGVVPAAIAQPTAMVRVIERAAGVTGSPSINGTLVPEAEKAAPTLPVNEVADTVPGAFAVPCGRVIQVTVRPPFDAGIEPEEVARMTVVEETRVTPRLLLEAARRRPDSRRPDSRRAECRPADCGRGRQRHSVGFNVAQLVGLAVFPECLPFNLPGIRCLLTQLGSPATKSVHGQFFPSDDCVPKVHYPRMHTKPVLRVQSQE